MQNTTTVPSRYLRLFGFGTLALSGVLLLPPGASANQPDARKPADIYRQVCAHCHAVERAVGPTTITMAVPEAGREAWGGYVRMIVRNGRAAMPAFREAEISDAELDALVEALARGDFAEPDTGEE